MRLQADFENFRKRTAAEKESLRASVRGDTVAALLPLVSGEVCCERKRAGVAWHFMSHQAGWAVLELMQATFCALCVHFVAGASSTARCSALHVQSVALCCSSRWTTLSWPRSS